MDSQVETQPGVPSLLRVLNDRSALELMLSQGPLTRAELGRRTGLSRVTASQSLARLHARGLVEVVGSRSAGRGPNADLYGVPHDVGYAVGVDVHAAGVGVTVAGVTGETVGHATITAPSADVPEAVAELVESTLAKAGLSIDDVLSVVVGTPGLIVPQTGELTFSYDFPEPGPGLRATLEDLLGLPVTLENDVNLAAVAEYQVGAAVGQPSFVLIWVGSGVGLAVMVNGSLHRGATGAAGEIGYLPVPDVPLPDRVDHVSQGSFQRLVGAQALLRLADERGRAVASRDSAAVAALVAACAEDDEYLDEVARRIALGVAAVCTVLDPGLVVLSGETGLAGGDALARLVGGHVERVAPVHPRVVTSTVGRGAVLDGATLRAIRSAGQALLARLDAADDD